MAIISLAFAAIVLIGLSCAVQYFQNKNGAINRWTARKANENKEAEERLNVLRERYQQEGKRLQNRILEDLKAIARGEKKRLDARALEAAKALQARQGQRPEIIAAWWPVMRELSGEIVDPVGVHNRLNELLYPETLEDV